MRDVLASYLRDRIKDGGRVGFSTGGDDWGKQGETMDVKTTKTTQADKDSAKTFFSQSSAAKDVATGNKKILDTNETYVLIPKLSDPHKILRADTDESDDELK